MVDPSHKGKVYPTYQFTIEQGKVREFLLAIGDDNPVFAVDDPPLPPTFPALFPFWGAGGLEGVLNEIGVQVWNVLHSEQEYEYLAPIHVGDTVTAQPHITDIYTKDARSGKLEFVELVTDYTNQDGIPVLKERALIVVRG